MERPKEERPLEAPIPAEESALEPVTRPDDLVMHRGRVVPREQLERQREFGALMGRLPLRKLYEQ